MSALFTHKHTLNICVVVALLSSGQAWRAGAGGAGGSGGVQHATGALRAPAPPRRGPPAQRRPPWRKSWFAGVVQQRNCSPADAWSQRHRPHIPAMVRGCNTCRPFEPPYTLTCFFSSCYFTGMFEPHCAELYQYVQSLFRCAHLKSELNTCTHKQDLITSCWSQYCVQ